MSKFKNLHIAGIFLNALLSLFDSVSSETIITLSESCSSELAYNKVLHLLILKTRLSCFQIQRLKVYF